MGTETKCLQEGGGKSHKDGAGGVRVGWAASESLFLSVFSGFEIYWLRRALVTGLLNEGGLGGVSTSE